MRLFRRPEIRVGLVWLAIFVALVIPIAAAAFSPFLAWRGPVYIVAGFAGIIAFGLLFLQPLLALRLLPKMPAKTSRYMHNITGGALILAIVLHVGGLYITSPPDVIDALLFRSPTPFSLWGVLGMWALFASSLIAIFRYRLISRLKITYANWRLVHAGLGLFIALCTIAHALMIEGTMETTTKLGLCLIVFLSTFWAIVVTIKPKWSSLLQIGDFKEKTE